ncbi:MAG: alpha/beta hydrolase [Pseudomonadota bacterium]
MFAGFKSVDIGVSGALIHARVGGIGPPLLLLHGYPQTHLMWHPLAAQLAARFTVIASDLRGYGASEATSGDMSFRAMAADQVALMRELGHARFHVLAHDRGARTAHRMVFDHPGNVRSVVLLDILPTLDVWRTMDDHLAMRYFHWLFLAQPGDMPQKLISGDPIRYLHAALKGLSGDIETFDPAALAAYEEAARKPSVVAAWCADYTAAAGIDLEHDRANLGQTSDIPCHVLWGGKGVVAHQIDPLAVWQAWFPKARGAPIDAGHFLVEERPSAVLQALKPHLADIAKMG